MDTKRKRCPLLMMGQYASPVEQEFGSEYIKVNDACRCMGEDCGMWREHVDNKVVGTGECGIKFPTDLTPEFAFIVRMLGEIRDVLEPAK